MIRTITLCHCCISNFTLYFHSLRKPQVIIYPMTTKHNIDWLVINSLILLNCGLFSSYQLRSHDYVKEKIEIMIKDSQCFKLLAQPIYLSSDIFPL